MDNEFLDDLFLEESDFLDPNSLSGPAANAYDSFGPNRSQYHYNDHDCMTAGEGGDILSCLLSPKESIVSSDVGPTMSDGWALETTLWSDPSLAKLDTNHQLPFLLQSGIDSDFGLFDPPNTQEKDHYLQNDKFFLGSSSMSMAENTLLDPLRSFYTDSLLDQQSSSPLIYTPTSSNTSDNGNIGATQQHFSEDLWSSNYPEFDDIEHPLGSHPQWSHETQQHEITDSTPSIPASTYITLLPERLDLSPTVFGPPPLLPPPEQLMTTFESRQPKTTVSKGKKAYTVEERKKVGLVRKRGACWQCQMRKIACSADETCTRCRAVASNPKLAEQICLRQRLMDIYLSHSSIYEMIVTSQERNSRVIRLSPGITEQISFKLEAMSEDSDSPTLTLTTIHYERISPGSGLSGSYNNPVPWHLPAIYHRAILPGSDPSIEQLENLSRAGIGKVHDPFLSHDLHDKIDYVLLSYSKTRSPHQPLLIHDLVTATLRVINLRSFLMHSLVFTHVATAAGITSHNSSPADPILNQHIRAIALAGISRAEKSILSHFQPNHLPRLFSLDIFSLMVAKACFLRLLLVYRNDVLLCERSVKIPVKSRVIFATRLEKVRFMYRVAVATFATLCERTSTSLFAPFEWSLGDVQQNDPIIQCGMANAIKELGTAYTIFCEQELSLEHDEIFRFFLMGTGRKGGRKGLE